MGKVAPGIDLLPSGHFRWRIMINGVPRRGVADTLAGARQARQAAKIDNGGTISPTTITVQELVDMWQLETTSAPATIEARNYALSKVPAVFMTRHVVDVTPPVAAALWREMKRTATPNGTLSPHIIAEARKALSGAWAHGVEWGIATTNPIRAAKFAKPLAAEINPPSPADVVKLIDYFANPRPARNPDRKHSRKIPKNARPELAAWCQLVATIGARPGEACAIRWDRLDPKTRVLWIGPSSGEGGMTEGKIGRSGWRYVELDIDTYAMVKAVPRVVGIPWVFHRDGEPWTPRYVRREITRATDILGIDGAHPYSLRHFAVTQALDAGRTISEVAQMIGDNPSTVYKTYAHWAGKPVAGAVASNAAVLADARADALRKA